MEFERALFRVHQRMLQAEPTRKARRMAERGLPFAIAGCGLALCWLHWEYVGRTRCLPGALQRSGLWNSTSGAPALADDAVLAVVVTREGGSLQTLAEDAMLGEGLTLRMPGSGDTRTSSGPPTLRLSSGGGPLTGETLARYRFAADRDVILLRRKVFKAHAFNTSVVSVSESCLIGPNVWKLLFRLFDGYDVPIINDLAYTFRSKGYLERYDGEASEGWEVKQRLESWAWSKEEVEWTVPAEGRWLITALARKVLLLAKAICVVLLISGTTGYFIRVAVNGSAVLMFPVSLAAQRYGNGRVSLSLLTRSFPWIGVHVEVLRRAGRPLGPLFKSHLAFLFLQSFAYLACNLAWRVVIYRKSSPEGFEERVFSFCSLLELYNLLFVRSVSTTAVFPLLVVATMVYLHFYVFSALYPFHGLAFSMCACICLYVMVYCLNHFEEAALRADPYLLTTPTLLHPRAAYMPQLSPSWSLESAPHWTMFYPLDPPNTFPEEATRHLFNAEEMLP